jgi:hypothetical protein
MSDNPTLIQVAFLATASRADVARFASLLFFDLELLEEGDDRLWVTALLRLGSRCAISLLASGLYSGLRSQGELPRFEACSVTRDLGGLDGGEGNAEPLVFYDGPLGDVGILVEAAIGERGPRRESPRVRLPIREPARACRPGAGCSVRAPPGR